MALNAIRGVRKLRSLAFLPLWSKPEVRGRPSNIRFPPENIRRVALVGHRVEQPCVRPICAVHMTAGHSALRGSAPGQNLAWEDAMAIWVVLIAGSIGTALRSVRPPTVTSHRMSGVISSRSRHESGGFIVAFVPGRHRPSHSGEFVGARDGGDLGGSPRQQSCEPGPMPGAVDLWHSGSLRARQP
jgi:hypothetical protein